ncbi:MAG: hypothetical protein MUP22_03165 [Desulfobacterales bacterium]|nr:hypothetical protein [Desulfobacterales bacterium]
MTKAKKLNHFKKWVFWTGIFNIVTYSSFLCPFTLEKFLQVNGKIENVLGLGGTPLVLPSNINHLILIHILGAIVVFLGVMLVIASFDIKNRAWFVFYEGLIRIMAFIYILYFVLFSNAAHSMMIFGAIDLLIGMIYMYFIFSIKGLKIR